MKNPYGLADFARIRREGSFYADKTRFIPLLESEELANRYLLFLRPRRIGKSLFISTLENYYDLARADAFDELFDGLYIHTHPTALRNSLLVLKLDFSTVLTSSGPARLEASFLAAVREKVREMVLRYRTLTADFEAFLARIDAFQDAGGLMEGVFAVVRASGHPLYVLIDEYDNFTNDLLARGEFSLYVDSVEGTGFVRTFYKSLKEATSTGAVARIFITGVSPVTVTDLASGFNIATSISLDPRFNALAGFTLEEVGWAVDEFLAYSPELGTREGLMEELQRYYNGYLFTLQGSERLFNSTMVLHYLMQLRRYGQPPTELLDANLRTDYTKLRAVATPPDENQDWHLELLESLLSEGRTTGDLAEQFGARGLDQQQNLISLLYYMGMLTLDGYVRGELFLRVPNAVIRRMHWEELAVILHERANVRIETRFLQRAVSRMAWDGDPGPFISMLQEKVLDVLANRDLMQFDERAIKVIFLTYLTLSPVYRPISEAEFAHGYCDIFLGLDRRFPDAEYAYLIELKYLKAGSSETQVEAKRLEAVEQIERYVSDPILLPLLKGDRKLRAISLVVVGARESHWRLEREI